MSEVSTLTSLVLLKHQVDKGKDYYDYLVPFIEQIYVNHPNKSFDDEKIRQRILHEFGLEVPLPVVVRVIRRMCKRSILERSPAGVSRGPRLSEKDLSPTISEASKKIESVQTALVQYAKSIGRKNFTRDDATSSIQQFLRSFQIHCIQSYVKGTTLPKPKKSGDWQVVLVGLFITFIRKSDNDLYEDFMVFVQGNMLANALRSTEEDTPPSSFKNTTFYFDTRDVLGSLGYSGEEKEAQAKELMKLLARLGGQIAVFSHNVEEARGVVDATANNVENLHYAHLPLNTVARKNEWKKSDLILKRESLDVDIEDVGFQIKPTPTRIHRFQIDEAVLREVIQANVKYGSDSSKPLDCDVKSINSIYTLRMSDHSRMSNPKRVEDCKAILVTSNSALASAAFEFAKDDDGEQGYSSIIGSFSLANIAWLKAPDFGSALIDAQAIAQAYSALRLSDDELSEIHKIAERLQKGGAITYEDLQLLRTTSIVEDVATMKASGHQIRDDETITAIVRNIRAVHSSEADNVKKELVKLQKKNIAVQGELQEMKRLERQRNDTIKFRKQIAKSIFGLFFILLAATIFSLAVLSYTTGAFLSIPIVSLLFNSKFPTGLAVLASLIIGMRLNGWGRRVHNLVRRLPMGYAWIAWLIALLFKQ